MFAAHGGHEMAARALLTAGADTEVVHSGGGTALSVPPPGWPRSSAGPRRKCDHAL